MQQKQVFSNKNAATALLLINGLLISLMLALAKEVTSAGIHPVAYAFWQTFVAGLLLIAGSCREHTQLKRNIFKYCLISGLTGIAIPNAIAFFLVGKLGSGFTGIMYALPPIFTFCISIMVGMASFKAHKLFGLSLAVIACTWIILERNELTLDVNPYWFALGVVIPIMLSIGNVYRAVAWPVGIKAMPLAAGTLLAASFLLGVYGFLAKVPIISGEFSRNTLSLILLQGILTSATFLCSFELQKRSDPVFYSQLGSVAAVVGLLVGVLWFDERYSISIWLGVLALLAGLGMNNMSSLSFKLTFIQPLFMRPVRKLLLQRKRVD